MAQSQHSRCQAMELWDECLFAQYLATFVVGKLDIKTTEEA